MIQYFFVTNYYLQPDLPVKTSCFKQKTFLFSGSAGSITLYGKNGDSGKRPLKKGFVKDDADKFTIECIDLGELKKVNLEHDNSGLRKHWLVDRVEVKDPHTNRTYVFPCNKWLSKVKEDGEIQRDLFPLVEERPMSRSSLAKSPRNSSRELDRDLSRSFDRRDRDLDMARGQGRGREFEREVGMSPGRSREWEMDREMVRGGGREAGRGRGFEREVPRSSMRDFEREMSKGFDKQLERGGGSGFGERGSARGFDREMMRR